MTFSARSVDFSMLLQMSKPFVAGRVAVVEGGADLCKVFVRKALQLSRSAQICVRSVGERRGSFA